MTHAQIIAIATPVFFLLIAVELAVGRARGHNTYRLNDALSSIGLGVMSEVVKIYSRVLFIGIYALAHSQFAILALDAQQWWVWALALLGYDFLYYWYHRAAHRVSILWAAHVVHHQSEDFNLSTALRQSSSGFLLSWAFYLPLAVLGVPPEVFAIVALVDLLYQYWVHTQHIGRLGWFDRWFCSPSNHRVHHAVNDRYLDRNFGGILVVWDRLFGTYAEELDSDPCVYGTREPLRTFNPLWANLQVWRNLAMDCWRTPRWADKIAVWFKPPGWRPADVAQAWPRVRLDMRRIERHDSAMSLAARCLALVLFAVALALSFGLSRHAGADMTEPQRLALAVLVVVLLTVMGVVCNAKPVATASGAKGAVARR